MHYVWAIVLFNFLHQQQAVLTDQQGTVMQFKDRNACQNELIARKLADISILGIHGECQQIGTLAKMKLLHLKVPPIK